jgi:hypothetical protein
MPPTPLNDENRPPPAPPGPGSIPSLPNLPSEHSQIPDRLIKEQTAAPTLSSRRTIPVRVTRSPSAKSENGSHVLNPRISPEEAEKLAVRYEEADGRFALRTGHLQGHQALGCDVVSFVNESDRDRYKAGDVAAEAVIDRFIEVKTSTAALSGNELISARINANHFYIYHVAASADGWNVSILQDPLRFPSVTSVEVDLHNVEETEYWHVRSAE